MESLAKKIKFILLFILAIFFTGCSKKTTMCKTYSELRYDQQERERSTRIIKATFIVVLVFFTGSIH